MKTNNLGYPRIGNNRELKKASELYWANQITADELLEVGKNIRKKNWLLQAQSGIDLIPSNDFSFYDQVLDLTLTLGAIPNRYNDFARTNNSLDLYFAMARGSQKGEQDVVAMEMTKWFDTNYHYIQRGVTTLVRFDAVYHGHFKCNLRRIADYPNLSNWLRELYQWPGIAETVDFQHIKNHYYGSHKTINPTGVVPKGPEQDFTVAHDRARLGGKEVWRRG